MATLPALFGHGRPLCINSFSLGLDSVLAVNETGPEPASELGLEHQVGVVSKAPQQGSGRTSDNELGLEHSSRD